MDDQKLLRMGLNNEFSGLLANVLKSLCNLHTAMRDIKTEIPQEIINHNINYLRRCIHDLSSKVDEDTSTLCTNYSVVSMLLLDNVKAKIQILDNSDHKTKLLDDIRRINVCIAPIRNYIGADRFDFLVQELRDSMEKEESSKKSTEHRATSRVVNHQKREKNRNSVSVSGGIAL